MIDGAVFPTEVHGLIRVYAHHRALERWYGVVSFSARPSSWAKTRVEGKTIPVGHNQVDDCRVERKERVKAVVVVVIGTHTEGAAGGCERTVRAYDGDRTTRSPDRDISL